MSEPQPRWSEVSQREARTHIYANGKYVAPGDHAHDVVARIERATRWQRRKAKTRANIGLVRTLVRAVREALRERRERPVDF